MIMLFQKFLISRFSGWLALAAVIAIIGFYGYARHIGFKACEDKQIIKQSHIVEKRNEIANNRPDDSATIKRLLGGKF